MRQARERRGLAVEELDGLPRVGAIEAKFFDKNAHFGADDARAEGRCKAAATAEGLDFVRVFSAFDHGGYVTRVGVHVGRDGLKRTHF
jgi:hypothetical protein